MQHPALRLVLLVWSLGGFPWGGGLWAESGTGEVRRLAPGERMERSMGSTEVHLYEVAAKGPFLILVEQRGIDVLLEVQGPDGAILGKANAPTGRQGPESFLVAPAAIGLYRLTVTADPGTGTPGQYELGIEDLAEASQERLAAEQRVSEAGRLLGGQAPEARRQAAMLYRASLEDWRKLGDRRREAWALFAAGSAHLLSGEARPGLEAFSEDLLLWEEISESLRQADCLTGIGLAQLNLGEVGAATDAFERALALQRVHGDHYGETRTLNNLCVIRHSRGELREALACYAEVLAGYQTLGEPDREANTRLNMAAVQETLGDVAPARANYEQVLAYARSVGERRREAQALMNLSVLDSVTGGKGQAIQGSEIALEIFRGLGDRSWEASTLQNLGSWYLDLGQPERSLGFQEQAVEVLRGLKDRVRLARALNGLGRTRRELGDLARAEEAHREALDLAGGAEARREEALALLFLGQTQAEEGAQETALTALTGAAEILAALGDRRMRAAALQETARIRLHRGELDRAGDLLTEAITLTREVEEPYQEADLLTDLAELARRRGALREAEERSAEAMTLVEALRTELAPTDLRASFLATRRKAYELAILVQADLQREDPAGSHVPASLEIAERARARVLLDLVSAGVRSDAPAPPRVLRTGEMQTLLDPGTLLLELSLGTEKSFLWLIDQASVQLIELPPRREIEAAATAFSEELRSPGRRQTRQDRMDLLARGRALSRMILSPLAGRAERRLAIVADGALQILPFAALPIPDAEDPADETLLIDRYEVVMLPSAAVLAAKRQEPAETSATRTLLAFADPAFATAPGGDRPPFAPLPATRLEAKAIQALLPPDEVVLATGLDAGRGRALSGDLSHFRILHFATHGLIDEKTPRLSGLALSDVDARGAPREGFLSLADISSLRLDAGLVVLSGCATALGREVSGEGLIGLARAFMYAGADRVVASLWNVRDRATAELMSRFYAGMFCDGLAPAAALRAAQLSFRAGRPWRDPYYWAPFVIQGDWRPELPSKFRCAPSAILPAKAALGE